MNNNNYVESSCNIYRNEFTLNQTFIKINLSIHLMVVIHILIPFCENL